MRPDLTKSQRRRIRELAGMAYERELSRELSGLEEDFARWRRGEIDPHELAERVHQFHQGPSRRLFLVYTGSGLDVAVVAAIVRGILNEEEVGPEIMDLFGGSVELARQRRTAAGGDDSDGNSGSADAD